MYYYVSSAGDVVLGVNGEDKGVFFSGVDTRRQLWGMVDVYGNSNIIELVDPRRTLNNIRSSHPITPEIKLRRSESCGKLPITSDVESESKQLARSTFHQACLGKNVTLNNKRDVATRSETEFCNGYVFLDSPLQPGESLAVRVLETESSYIGSLAFGLTGADPWQLQSNDLPDDSDLLSQRPEYWVHTKDVLQHPQAGDELCFSLGLDGAVTFSVNGGPLQVLFDADISIPTRPFIDIFGVAQKLQLLGVSPAQSSQITSNQNSSRKSAARPKSCFSDSLMTPKECVICRDNAVDCVLYSCGHMCLCFQCATQQWFGAGECPICRDTIRDVIRTFSA
jgi:protein neuralized